MKAKKIADDKYERHSAYKSMFLVKTYKDLGGNYESNKKSNNLSRWRTEEWV